MGTNGLMGSAWVTSRVSPEVKVRRASGWACCEDSCRRRRAEPPHVHFGGHSWGGVLGGVGGLGGNMGSGRDGGGNMGGGRDGGNLHEAQQTSAMSGSAHAPLWAPSAHGGM